MASTKIPAELSSTPGIVDNSNATAITIDSSENTTFAGTISSGDITITSAGAAISLVDSDNNPDYQIKNGNGSFRIIDTTNSADRININTSGNVGIGTTSPDYPLEVENTGVYHVNVKQTKTSTSDTSAYATYYLQNLAGSSGTISGYLGAGGAGVGNTAMRNTVYMGAQSNHDVAIFTNDVERVRINSSGSVGIGVSSPSKPLHIYSASDTAIRLQNSTTGTGTTDGLLLEQSGSDSLLVNYEAGNMRLLTSGSERMRITSSGNIGIGISSPSAELHLYKASAGTPHYDSYATQIIEDTEARLQLMANDGGNNAASLLLSNEDKHWGITNHGTSSSHRFAIGYKDTSASNTDIIDAQEDIFNITTAGNVGIGSNNPTHKLVVSENSSGLAANFLNSNTSGAGVNIAAASGDTNYAFRVEDYAGNEKVRINGSGKVGIGTSSPGHRLDVQHTITSGGSDAIANFGTSGSGNWANSGHQVVIGGPSVLTYTGLIIHSDSTSGNGQISFADGRGANDSWRGVIAYSHSSDYMHFWTNANERMRITSGGDVSIGSDHSGFSGYRVLNLRGGSTGGIYNLENSSGTRTASLLNTGSDLRLQTFVSGGGILFEPEGTERMRIESNGDICIGTTAAFRGSERVSILGGNADTIATYTHAASIVARKASFSNGFFFLFEANNGTAIGSVTSNGSSTSYNTSSDYRLKENIKPMKNGLDRLNKLNPVSFNWKETGINSEGFLAHEVDEVFSDCVYGEKDGDEIQSMDYGRITPLLVKAIQEQQELIDALQSEINLLKGE